MSYFSCGGSEKGDFEKCSFCPDSNFFSLATVCCSHRNAILSPLNGFMGANSVTSG